MLKGDIFKIVGISPQDMSEPPWSDFIDEEGRYSAQRIADVLDWKKEEMARYLGRDKSAVTRRPTSDGFQEALAALARLAARIFGLAAGNVASVRAWLRTSNWALDDRTPTALIISGERDKVIDLLDELEAGTLA